MHPDYQRRGIGPELAGALISVGASAGVHAFLSQITSENVGSLAMAARLGFERVGLLREVGEKFGRTLDVVIAEKLV